MHGNGHEMGIDGPTSCKEFHGQTYNQSLRVEIEKATMYISEKVT